MNYRNLPYNFSPDSQIIETPSYFNGATRFNPSSINSQIQDLALRRRNQMQPQRTVTPITNSTFSSLFTDLSDNLAERRSRPLRPKQEAARRHTMGLIRNAIGKL